MNNIYLVSDIFGNTPALQELASHLNTLLTYSKQDLTPDSPSLTAIPKIYIVDPYQGKQMNFVNEAAAYAYFTEQFGVSAYAQHLHSILTSANLTLATNANVIGFSVGASALWSISDKSDISVNHAIYFYGSQIRHLLDIQPCIKSTVVFPSKEEHFSVDDLHEKIKKLPNVSTNRSEFFHGFMNQHSVNFNEQAYTTYINWLCQNLIQK